jgi:hypothetical protein
MISLLPRFQSSPSTSYHIPPPKTKISLKKITLGDVVYFIHFFVPRSGKKINFQKCTKRKDQKYQLVMFSNLPKTFRDDEDTKRELEKRLLLLDLNGLSIGVFKK